MKTIVVTHVACALTQAHDGFCYSDFLTVLNVSRSCLFLSVYAVLLEAF